MSAHTQGPSCLYADDVTMVVVFPLFRERTRTSLSCLVAVQAVQAVPITLPLMPPPKRTQYATNCIHFRGLDAVMLAHNVPPFSTFHSGLFTSTIQKKPSFFFGLYSVPDDESTLLSLVDGFVLAVWRSGGTGTLE